MSTRKRSSTMLIIRAIVVVAVLIALVYFKSNEPPKDKPAGENPRPPAPSGEIVMEGETAKNVVVHDEDGEVLYRGDVDLSKTIDRIESGKELDWHDNDGEVFGNFEKRLPKKERGYYREWVHPTPGRKGAGPQRIITGKDGEIYYSPDHYEHFYLVP